MAITPPTAADLKARYPEFAPVGDALVSAVIGEAALFVDESWRESDRAPAILARAAHMLALEGEPARAQGSGSGVANGTVRRVKVGDVETEFAPRIQGAEASAMSSMSLGLTDTPYGKRFLELRRRNFPGVVVA